MAPIGGPTGGGQAGFGSGGGFTGPAQALEIVGDHAYAYSGLINTAATQYTETTYLEFTSGNYLFVGTFQANNMDFEGGSAGTDDMVYKLYLNGALVQGYRASSAGPYTEPDGTIPLMIPAYTIVKATTANITTDTARPNLLSLIGRIYRE